MQNKYFSEVAKCWLDSRKGVVKKSSYYRYEQTINSYLLPRFKTYKIKEITNDEIENFIKSQLDNYKINTIKSMFYTLTLILRFSDEKNVMSWRKLGIKRNKKNIDVLTEDESVLLNKTLLSNAHNNKDMGILLALNLGLRIGEICALKWQDINMYKKSIRINHTMQRVKCDDINGVKTRVELLDPKSLNSKREVPIPDFLYRKLELMKQEAQSKNSFLLPGKDEEFIEPRNLERYFKKKCTEIIGRAIKFHNLRHTFASISLSNNIDSKAVSETLGHCSVYTTITFYQSVGFNDKYKGVQQLASVIGV